MSERVGAQRATGWIVVNILVLVYALLPVLWILSLSLKPSSSVKDGKLIPAKVTFENYKAIFQGNIFSSALINSIGIGLITTVIAVLVGGMAAYAIARLAFPGKKALVGVALLIAMFPQISLVTPIFNIERRIGLFDTWPGLIIPYITFALPLAIYTMSAFFKEIPWDLEKAAKMDGATPGQAFRKVIAPLAGGDRQLHRQFAIRGADGVHCRRRDGDHRADHHLRINLPTADRRRFDVRCGEGVIRWPRSCWIT
jgi:multiple sugar transport system permease protein